jgi:hypothetical protein
MKTRRNSLVLLAATAFCASWTGAARAEPITYTFTAEGPITGTLGGVAIGGMNQFLTFTFVSDTSDVQPFTFGDGDRSGRARVYAPQSFEFVSPTGWRRRVRAITIF